MSEPRTSPSNFSVVTIGVSPAFVSLVSEAAERAFPGAKITSVGSVGEASKIARHADVELIALLDAAPEAVSAAAGAFDEVQLPRWGVVVFSSEPTTSAQTEVLALGDWNPRTLGVLLQRAGELQRLRREEARFRGEFLAVGTRVVHDLRSPLGGILTTAEVIKEILEEASPSNAALTEPLIESTDGMTKIIRQLSTFAKATAGLKAKERLNMSLPFWAAFQQVERQALQAGAILRQPAKWPDVEGESGLLQAMWHALLCNSIQHTGPNPRVEAGWTRLGGENRFWLMDGGHIPPAKRATLFMPFHLLHQPSAPRGFGLPIVRRLAELQGGRCGYEPAPEGGSCFFFTLPALDNESAG